MVEENGGRLGRKKNTIKPRYTGSASNIIPPMMKAVLLFHEWALFYFLCWQWQKSTNNGIQLYLVGSRISVTFQTSLLANRFFQRSLKMTWNFWKRYPIFMISRTDLVIRIISSQHSLDTSNRWMLLILLKTKKEKARGIWTWEERSQMPKARDTTQWKVLLANGQDNQNTLL